MATDTEVLAEIILETASQEADVQKRDRLLEMADQLRQNTRPLQGQMVGKIYVPPAHTQGLANVLRQGLSGYYGRKGEQKNDEIMKSRGQSRADYLRSIFGQQILPRQNYPDGVGP